jgi:CRP-like cAMP-binding protein
MFDGMIDLAARLPEIELAPGDVLCGEGDHSGSIWVLVDGSLVVTKQGVEINRVNQPGALIGEMAVLLRGDNQATVTAITPSRLRVAGDGAGWLGSDPAIITGVAVGLATRLNFLTSYLADLKHQYGDAPGLAMVGDVLKELAGHEGPPVRLGSARDPHPEY